MFFPTHSAITINNVCPWGPEIYLPTMLSEAEKEKMAEREAAAASSSASTDLTLESEPLALTASDNKNIKNGDDGDIGASPLMNLPAEIRLQIYGWLHRMHPVQHAQLAPWYPTPIYSAYFLRAVMPTLDTFDAATDAEVTSAGLTKLIESEAEGKTQGPRLLSPHRPLACIPSAFMRAGRKVYDECRTIPFLENEFVFVNWFSSGIWAARAFTKGLKPWQREVMRYARLEMLARDFTGAGLKEWKDLCTFWSPGLRGLRLKVLVGGSVFGPVTDDTQTTGSAPEREAMSVADGTPKPWIEEGLKKIAALRSLEVELVVSDWTNEQKLEWSSALEGILNEGRGVGEERVSVVSAERELDKKRPAHEDTSGKFA
jgi:hypothetical protein